MDVEIKSDVQDDILVVTFSGQVTDGNVHALIKRYFEVALGSGLKRILVDLRPLEGRLSLGNTYFVIRELPAPVPPDVTTALVENKRFRKNGEFLQVALKNVGINLRLFLDYDEAFAWLRSL
jgi:hypothetical protein